MQSSCRRWFLTCQFSRGNRLILSVIRYETNEMGNTIWVKVETGGDVQCDKRDHSIMCSLDRKLDQIAWSAGVTPISEFFDGSEMAAEFADDDIQIPDPQWYEPTVALVTINALLAHLNENPDVFTYADDPSRAHWRSYLMDELDNCKTMLESAVRWGGRFHFAIVM